MQIKIETPDFAFLGVKSGVSFAKHWFSMFIAVRTGLTGLTRLTRLMGLPQPTPLELPGACCCRNCQDCLLLPKQPGLPAAATAEAACCGRLIPSGTGAMAYLLPPPRWRVPVSTTHGNQQESDTVLYFVIYESAHASDLFSRTLVT